MSESVIRFSSRDLPQGVKKFFLLAAYDDDSKLMSDFVGSIQDAVPYAYQYWELSSERVRRSSMVGDKIGVRYYEQDYMDDGECVTMCMTHWFRIDSVGFTETDANVSYTSYANTDTF